MYINTMKRIYIFIINVYIYVMYLSNVYAVCIINHRAGPPGVIEYDHAYNCNTASAAAAAMRSQK